MNMQHTLALLRQSSVGTPLRARSKQLTRDDIASHFVQTLCKDILATHLAAQGAGLAAPQVGENVAIIAVNVGEAPLLLINPRIQSRSFDRNAMFEGCLSIPGFLARVRRSLMTEVEYLDMHGARQFLRLRGFDARVLQHEVDHLHGKLILDYIQPGREAHDFQMNKEEE